MKGYGTLTFVLDEGDPARTEVQVTSLHRVRALVFGGGSMLELDAPDLDSVRAFLDGIGQTIDTYEQNRAAMDAAWPQGPF